MIHEKGTNPYTYARECGIIGEARHKLLDDYRTTGQLPEGFTLWDDASRVEITNRDQIDWTGFRPFKH
jgi:hypothetical protein